MVRVEEARDEDLALLSYKSDQETEATVAQTRERRLTTRRRWRTEEGARQCRWRRRASVRNKGEMEAMSSFNKAKLRTVEKNLDKGLDKGSPSEAIELMSAKERAQAAIVLAEARVAMEDEARLVAE
ncbi:hypothetical protein QYE76_004822 [Lolium multiflorum]|uniref:Uncharacterized protein n=1 Tax=Lolium multiflorum TaxID=4521 RepID=A0AAD8RTU7_LOLMU|nr:hypothetical protein QYE76_004822 [Lolium multiflorum]